MPQPTLVAPRVAKSDKPPGCTGCSLQERGHGFVPPSGPENAAILWMGEAPGYDEAAIGMINRKTTAVRVIPAPGKKPGDMVDVAYTEAIAVSVVPTK